MKSEITIILITVGLFAAIGFYSFYTTMQKSFDNTPTDVVDGAAVWSQQREHAQETELKRKEMMERMRQQMQQHRY